MVLSTNFPFYRSSSPKERKPFSDEVNANVDIESSLSTDEKNAYKALIEGFAAKGVDVENNDSTFDNDVDDLKRSFSYVGGACNDNAPFYVNDTMVRNFIITCFIILFLIKWSSQPLLQINFLFQELNWEVE